MLQAAGLLVELVEVGLQAGDLLALLVEVVDGAEGVANDLRDAGEAVGDALFGDLEQRAHDAIEDGERVFALVVRLGDRERGVLDQLPQQRAVFDDADVFLNAEAAGQTLGEGEDVGDSADGIDLFAAAELVGQGDDVDRAAGVDELAHAREDALVGIEREIVGGDALGGLVVGGVFEQDGAEDRALGVDAGGQAAFKGDVGGGGHALSLGSLAMRKTADCVHR